MKNFTHFLSKSSFILVFILGVIFNQNAFGQSCAISGDLESCQNEVVTYSTSTVGEVYQWNAYNGIVSGLGSTVSVSWNNPGTGILTLVVKDSLNQVICTQSLNVTIHELPQPAIHPSFMSSCNNNSQGGEGANGDKEDRNPCFSVCDSTWVTYTTAFHSGSSYSWNITGMADVITSTTNEISVMWTGTGTGLVEVIETDAYGCIGTIEACVEILPKPIAAFNTMPEAIGGIVTVCKDQDVLFVNQSSIGGGSPLWAYTWIFDDGTTEVIDASTNNGNTIHNYSSSGTYNVMLVAENECHCKDTAFITVQVSDNPGPNIECISTVCPGSMVSYSTDSLCPDYLWSVTNGTIVGDSTQNEVTVSWGNSGPAYLTLQTDGCAGLCSSPTTVEIPIITPSATIHGNELVCQYECETYKLDCNIPVDSIIWHFPAGVNVQTDTINEHEVEVCFYDPSFTSGQIVVEYYHNTPGSLDDLSCGGVATLDIKLKPHLYLFYPTEICDSALLTGSYTTSPTGTMEWTITDATGTTNYLTLTQSANSPFEFNWVYGPGIFKITANDLSDNYCDAPQSFYLNVHELPAPPDSIVGPDPVCPGVPYQYYAFATSANYVMGWSFENGTPAQQVGQSASVVWDNAGPYVASVFQTNPLTGCKSAKYLDTIQSNLPLMPSEIWGNDTVCANGQQNYSTPSPGDDFVWSISPAIAGSVVSGQHEANIVVEWNNYNGPATLSLERTLCSQSITSDYDIEVIAPPVPGITVPTEACEGTLVSMSASAATGATFSWDFGDGTTATGALVDHVFNSAGSQMVTVEASYTGFCTGTATAMATIMINPKPNITISTPDPNIYCGTVSPVNMYVVSPVTGTSYDWYSNTSGSALSSGTAYTSSAIGMYYVIGENSFGCQDTSNIIAIDTNCVDACEPKTGSYVSFTQTRLDCNLDYFAGSYPAWASSPVYNFDDAFSGNNFAYTQNATHTFDEPGYYRVELCVKVPNSTDTDSCTICRTQIDTINYIPDFIDSLYCTNGSGMVSVKLINNTKVLSTAPAPTYEWTINSGSVVSTSENPTLMLAPGSYLITLIVNGTCEISKTIVIDALPTADIVAMDSICVDAPIAFTNLSMGPVSAYAWDFGDGASSLVNNPIKAYPSAGVYDVSLVVTNSYGCTDSSGTSITVLPNTLYAAIDAIPDTVFCEADSTMLQSLVTDGYPGYDYLWSTVETTPDIWGYYTGSYYLEVTDSKHCYSRSNQIGLLVNPTPKPQISGKKVLCFQDQETYTVNYPSGLYTLEWTVNGTPITWLTQNQYTFYAGTLGTNTIVVKVMSPDSCMGVDTLTIEVVPNPNVSISSSGALCEGEPNLMVGSSSNNNIVQSFWNNGNTSDSLYASVPGNYTFTVVDSLGCKASASQVVHPLPDFCGLMTGCYDLCDTVSNLVWHAPQGYASYQWLYNTNPISGSTYDTLHVPLYQSGDYQVVLTTDNGCSDTSDIIQITFVPCTSCDITVTDTLMCGPIDENGFQTYTVQFEIDNGFGPGAIVNIFSMEGNVTGISPSVIPLGTSLVNATFTDIAPIDTNVCFNVTLTYDNERCNTRICNVLPDCQPNCEFGVYGICAHCEKETSDGWEYDIELTVQNIFGANGTLSVLPISSGTFGTITPNPVPSGLTTVSIPFTDVAPYDSIICFRVLMEVNGRFCAQDVCVYLPDCRLTGIGNSTALQDFNIVPNPASNQITISGNFEPDAELSVLTLEGKVIETVHLTAPSITLPITDLKAGMYFIKVQQASGVLQQLFVKR